ncbi:cyclic nucleotide-binding domain-containing protein [Actinomadura fibrosa]|uniref:Cyclic nucleotide-binding domain-containing protein n=1 Tax=Actinomadura fibrosa TaxID=111802 RepID=A0ABW2XHR7_9ACTN|nr:cyclic nucleotide-binding domain-containing protein [Actinomadura fibrosa]
MSPRSIRSGRRSGEAARDRTAARARPLRRSVRTVVLAVIVAALVVLDRGLVVLAFAGLAVLLAALVVVAMTLRVRYLPVLGLTLTLVMLVTRNKGLVRNVGDLREVTDTATAALGALHRGAVPLPAAEPAPVKVASGAGAGAEVAGNRSAAVAGLGAAAVRNGPSDTPRSRFWDRLSPAEQEILMALAHREDFPAGAVLFREHQPADRVVLIEAGTVKVSVDAGGTDRQIALRGPGDLIGERAVLLVQERSATAVALTAVRARVASADEFNAFLDEHPRVVAVLERQFYDRLTHDAVAPAESPSRTHATAPGPAVPPTSAPGRAAGAAFRGEIHPILFADVIGFSGDHRTDGDRLRVRRALYAVLREAFGRSGIPWDDVYREDRGDGALIVLSADVPARLVLAPLAAHIATGLRLHNQRSPGAERIRLRLALDVGPVTSDEHGVAGSAVIHAARLLDAAEFKERMAATPAVVGLAVSAYVYDRIVRQGANQVDPAHYRRIDVEVKETRAPAWVVLAGDPGPGEQRGRCDGPARSGARSGDGARTVRAVRPHRRTPDGAAAGPRRG